MSQKSSEKEEMSETAKSAAAKLFDIRLMIGALFVVYGVILVIYGFVITPAELAKAAGININLWLGLGMLVLGGVFLLWAKLAPTEANKTDADGSAGH